MIISDFKRKKIVDYLKERRNGKVLLIFRHGLGDIINFLPLFEELKKRHSEWVFNLGLDKDRKLSILHKKTFEYDRFKFKELHRRFTFFFSISYREPFGNLIDKPTYCNLTEIGLDNFKWEPYRIPIELKNENSKRIGLHFFGNTNQKNKSLKREQALQLWDELESFGVDPFEIHNPKFNDSDSFDFSFMRKSQTLRFENPSIERMIQEISKCKYFIGIDSGVLYLAMSILGPDRVIGIEKNYVINKYAPIDINKINVKGEDDWDKKEIERLKGILT